MKTAIQKQLIRLNLQFYQKTGEKFALTRQASWPGWEKLFLSLKDKLPQKYEVLDLGCGNGRFLKFLINHSPTPSLYYGIDSSAYLLKCAKKITTTIKTEFSQQDIISQSPETYDKHFNLVTVMGLMHHIPGMAKRKDFLKAAFQLLKPEGFLAVSFWRLRSDTRQIKKIVSWKSVNIDEREVETNDYLVSWQKSQEYRYVHSFDDLEIELMKTWMPAAPRVTFLNDGKTKTLNQYIVWQK